MDTFIYYLIAINGAGFLFYGINKHVSLFQKLLFPIALAGGSLGVLLAILIMDRKAEKANMMICVFSACMLLIQV